MSFSARPFEKWWLSDFTKNYDFYQGTSRTLKHLLQEEVNQGAYTRVLENENFQCVFETPGCQKDNLSVQISETGLVTVQSSNLYTEKKHTVQLNDAYDRQPVFKNYSEGLLTLEFQKKKKQEKVITITF